MERERRVKTAQPSDEMVFEGANRFFGGVGAVAVWRNELEGDVVIPEELLERVGTLVIKDLKSGLEAPVGEVAVE